MYLVPGPNRENVGAGGPLVAFRIQVAVVIVNSFNLVSCFVAPNINVLLSGGYLGRDYFDEDGI